MVYDRNYWLEMMTKISYPVLSNLAEKKLKLKLPVDERKDRIQYASLEAFARTLSGIAPWLSLKLMETNEESTVKAKFLFLAQKSLDAATDPSSPDYMNFEEGDQPLVDTAFLAQAIIRAPDELFFSLEDNVKRNIINALKKTRKIKPYYNNWILFSAIIETALYLVGDNNYDVVRIEYALKQCEEWYKGDGIYGDGPKFHWDYYNSFVIHPMLNDILKILGNDYPDWQKMKEEQFKRSRRYAEILERLISPEGTFPVFGRSITLRCGVFHLLSQAVLSHQLPQSLSPSQVRCALTAVIKKLMENENNFDSNGWLKIGFSGYQPNLGEEYISVGSLYHCLSIFLPLGLPPSDPFWCDKPQAWTSKKIWLGENLNSDHAID